MWSGFNKHKNYHFHECVAHKVSVLDLLNQIANNNKIFEGFRLKVDDLGTLLHRAFNPRAVSTQLTEFRLTELRFFLAFPLITF